MFNLENIDFDLDEDFSSNIFSNKVSSNKIENEKIKKNEIVSKNKIFEPFNEFNKESKEEKKIGNILNCELSGEKSLKRSLKEHEKPQKKRLSHEGLLQRRFPGPAGLLPDKPFKEIGEVSFLLEKNYNEREKEKEKGRESESESEEREKEKCVLYSQCSGSVFLESAYEKLSNDFNLNESENPLKRYTVEWVKRVCVGKGFQGRKVPFLGVVVHVVDHSVPDPLLVLRDPTGEISGSLHREVWAEMGGKLKSGIALALRQVGVLMTGVIRRQIYLNITMNNILAIYSSSENKSEVEITTVNKASKAELLNNFSEWLAPSRISSPRPPPPSFPFTTIDDQNKKLSTKNKEIFNFDNRKETEIFNDFGIDLCDSDFSEEMGIPGNDGNKSGGSEVKRTSGHVLSPDESQIFEEVLSGINLDEFEM